MTLKKLLAEVKKIEGWKLGDDGAIRVKIETYTSCSTFCPLTAVYYKLHNEALFSTQYADAAEALKIGPRNMDSIVHAADNFPHFEHPVPKGNLQIRKLLLKACGLKEQKKVKQ